MMSGSRSSLIATTSFLLATWCVLLHSSFGFVTPSLPHFTTTTTKHSSPFSSRLWARYQPPSPPPTLPETTSQDRFFQQATKSLTETDLSAPSSQNNPFNLLQQQSEKLQSQLSDAFTTNTVPSIPAVPDKVWQTVQTKLDRLFQELPQLDSLSPLQDTSEWNDRFQSIQHQLEPYFPSRLLTVTAATPSTLDAILAATLTTLLVAQYWDWRQQGPSKPYPDGKYNPQMAQAYFVRRLPMMVGRGASILLQSLQFAVALGNDRLRGQEEENGVQRGKELAQLLTQLGPSFIKVGQSLSIRTDLLSPAYIKGLESLQDQVPPFDTAVARTILETEWGRPLSAVLAEPLLSDSPVAAASLGQVYKAQLRGDSSSSKRTTVAIKVQRPDITQQIALDMYLLRQFAMVAKVVFSFNTDAVGTVDAWGKGFVDELDYTEEAKNAEFFSSKIAETALADVVFAPTVVDQWSTGQVLVTEWVDGERLDRSNSKDITALCSIAMNTYLTMLLDIGLLHCDPHPGNLLRVKADGRLCILDWGMVTRLDSDLQLTLIEHMAHLTSADYGEVPRDLLLLGFIPPEKADSIEDSGVVDVLADIYGAWTSGGGAASVNVPQVITQLQQLQAQKGNLFQIPPYFAYIAKSFSVLEGIGLSYNPKYSIINECLPYVSNRLLTDQEKMGPALTTFIFGPEKSKPDRVVSYRRVEQLVEGFGEFSTSSSGALLGKKNQTRTQVLDETAEQILDLVFAEEETPLQHILLEQVAKIMASNSRYFLTNLRERSGVIPSTGRTILGTVLDPLGFWRTSPLVRMNELDEKTVETTRKLATLFQSQIEKTNNSAFDLSNLSREEVASLASTLVRKVWSRRTGIVQTSNRFTRQLLTLTAEKLERGERDTRSLPKRSLSVKDNQKTPALAAEKGKPERTKSSPGPESSRLQNARGLLERIQQDEVAKTATPVSSTQSLE